MILNIYDQCIKIIKLNDKLYIGLNNICIMHYVKRTSILANKNIENIILKTSIYDSEKLSKFLNINDIKNDNMFIDIKDKIDYILYLANEEFKKYDLMIKNINNGIYTDENGKTYILLSEIVKQKVYKETSCRMLCKETRIPIDINGKTDFLIETSYFSEYCGKSTIYDAKKQILNLIESKLQQNKVSTKMLSSQLNKHDLTDNANLKSIIDAIYDLKLDNKQLLLLMEKVLLKHDINKYLLKIIEKDGFALERKNRVSRGN